MSWLDQARAKAHAAITKLPGKAGELARKANDALGRPLADEAELEDRRAFATKGATVTTSSQTQAEPNASVAPVIVYHMDKTRRDALKLTEILEANGIPHKVSNIQEDPAAQSAIRRDSKGYRLPVVFIAGEVIGGRAELTNLASSGELKKKVFGSEP
ncbi:MAG TPA: glutaredoxin domain-containing protein [Kofleriaceae bacterium]|nr:glutaredoxin domain-containing protein [Kofleriaceae bacterium]